MKTPDIVVSVIVLMLLAIATLALVRGNPNDMWVPFALGNLILVIWSLYWLFRDVPDIHWRRPLSISILLLGSGVYVLGCVGFVYIFTTMGDPPYWPGIIVLAGPGLMGIVGFLHKWSTEK